MDVDLFIETYPELYHMAHPDALQGIRDRGLLSTSALLDLFGIDGEERLAIERRMRPRSVQITHPVYGVAVIRDQKPIVSDRVLARALNGSATPEQWHCLLNSKVFFWVNRKRLDTLRQAGAYRNDPQLFLVLDTRRVVESVGKGIWLSSMNSGACRPFAHPRSPQIFRRLADYDFEYWRRKRGRSNAVVECAVDRQVKDVESLLISTQIVE